MSWIEVDKLSGKSFREGKYKNESKDPCKQPVRAVTYDGIPQKYPRTHSEWQNYSCELLILFDKVWREEKIPVWSDLKFRQEDNFKAGIWGGFTETWLIFINCLPSEQAKFLAYKHITQGISIFDNQNYIAPKRAREFKRSKETY